MSESRRVLVALDWSFRSVREIITGILDYASRKTNWDVRILGNDPESSFSVFNPGWRPDGIIGNLDHLNSEHKHPRITARHNLYFSTRTKLRNAKAARWVLADNATIGQMAAEFFLKRRFIHFAFVGSLKGEAWSEERFAAFSETLADKHFVPFRYQAEIGSPTDWHVERDSLGKWLCTLPHPCALFAACDARARHVLETCRFLQIAIPEQIAVLGADNDEILCELSNPTLSSIELGFAEGGRIGAEVLDRMMSGETASVPLVSRYGAQHIVERISTADNHGSQRAVVLAQEIIRRRIKDPALNVDTIAAAINCSTRHLQKCFRSVRGSTVLQEIHHARLEQVRHLLRKTRIPIDEIHAHCGFSSSQTLKRIFKKSFHQTMSTYRNSH